MTVWTVEVVTVEREGGVDIHVFSTMEKAYAFARGRDETCVITNYEVDRPDLYYGEAA